MKSLAGHEFAAVRLRVEIESRRQSERLLQPHAHPFELLPHGVMRRQPAGVDSLHGVRKILRCSFPLQSQRRRASLFDVSLGGWKRRAQVGVQFVSQALQLFAECAQRFCQRCRIECASVCPAQGDRPAKKLRPEKAGDSLCAMVHEGIETQLPPGLAPKWRHIVQRKNVTARLLRTPLEPQDQDRTLSAAPDREAFPKLRGERLLVRSHLHGLRR